MVLLDGSRYSYYYFIPVDLNLAIVISPQSPGVLAAVDSTVHKTVGERFKISGFPTVKYFEKGEDKYTLPHLRSKDKIIEFMHK